MYDMWWKKCRECGREFKCSTIFLDIDFCSSCETIENWKEEYQTRVKQLQAKLNELRKIGEKYSKATEYYDEFITGGFARMPPIAKKLVTQISKEILEVLRDNG